MPRAVCGIEVRIRKRSLLAGYPRPISANAETRFNMVEFGRRGVTPSHQRCRGRVASMVRQDANGDAEHLGLCTKRILRVIVAGGCKGRQIWRPCLASQYHDRKTAATVINGSVSKFFMSMIMVPSMPARPHQSSVMYTSRKPVWPARRVRRLVSKTLLWDKHAPDVPISKSQYRLRFGSFKLAASSIAKG